MTYVTQIPQKSKSFIRHSLLELSPVLCTQNSTSEAPRRESAFNLYSVWACVSDGGRTERESTDCTQ